MVIILSKHDQNSAQKTWLQWRRLESIKSVDATNQSEFLWLQTRRVHWLAIANFLCTFHHDHIFISSCRGCSQTVLQRRCDFCIPRNQTARPQSQFPHSCICERFTIFPPWVYLFSCNRIGRPIVGICKSLTETWMWKLGLRPLSLISGNTYFWEYLFRVFGIVSLQCGGARPPSFTLSTASTRVTSLPPPPPQQNQRKGYCILSRRQSREYEAKFLDEIQTKILRVFLLAIHSHLYSTALSWVFYFFKRTQLLTVSTVHLLSL